MLAAQHLTWQAACTEFGVCRGGTCSQRSPPCLPCARRPLKQQPFACEAGWWGNKQLHQFSQLAGAPHILFLFHIILSLIVWPFDIFIYCSFPFFC